MSLIAIISAEYIGKSELLRPDKLQIAIEVYLNGDLNYGHDIR